MKKGNLIEQRVIYDCRLILCKRCHKYGHSKEHCYKNKVTSTKPRGQEVDDVQWQAKQHNKESQKQQTYVT